MPQRLHPSRGHDVPTIAYQTVPSSTIPYHTDTYHVLLHPFRFVSFHRATATSSFHSGPFTAFIPTVCTMYFCDLLTFPHEVIYTTPCCIIPYHTVPYRTIPYHTIPYHSIPYHTYHTIPYHTIPCHAMPCRAVPYHTIPYHTIPYLLNTPNRPVSYFRPVPYHTIPYLNIPHRTDPSHITFPYTSNHRSITSSSSSDAFTAFIPAVGTMYFCVLLIFCGMAGLLVMRTSFDALGCSTKLR